MDKERSAVLVYKLVAAIGVDMSHFCAVNIEGRPVLINSQSFRVDSWMSTEDISEVEQKESVNPVANILSKCQMGTISFGGELYILSRSLSAAAENKKQKGNDQADGHSRYHHPPQRCCLCSWTDEAKLYQHVVQCYNNNNTMTIQISHLIMSTTTWIVVYI